MRDKFCSSLVLALLGPVMASCASANYVGVQFDVVNRLTKEQASQDLVKGAAYVLDGTGNIPDWDDATITDVKVGSSGFRITVRSGRGRDYLFNRLPLATTRLGDLDVLGRPQHGLCWGHNSRHAGAEQRFMNALAYFKQHDRSQAEAESDFDKHLEGYKLMKSNELPEEVHKYQVQAYAAVDGKNFEHAEECFNKALNLAPWWPQGWFNLALTRAQLGDYFGAIEAMNRYLKLEPDAPDARDAKDKIYEWQDK